MKQNFWKGVCICTSISWYFNKIELIAFSGLAKNFLQRFQSFSVKRLPSYQDITVPNGVRKVPMIYFRHLNVSWVNAYQISCLFIFTLIYPLAKRPEGLAVRWKDYWTELKRAIFFHSTENNIEGRLVYK